MRTINAAWGRQQTELYTLGTLADANANRILFDATAATQAAPGALFAVRVRRADGVSYTGAAGIAPDGLNMVEYVIPARDMEVPGVLWLTLAAIAGANTYEWTLLCWVNAQAYDGGFGRMPPLWTLALLALGAAGNGAHLSGATASEGGGMSLAALNVTIAPQDWADGRAEITNAGIAGQSEGYITLPVGATLAQYELFAAARPRVAAQTTGKLTLALAGTTPDAPLTLRVCQFV